MCKATITGTLAILAGALLVSGAEAGGSASAASKYGHASQVQVATTYMAAGSARQVQRPDYGITEYSSSSARTHGAKYR